MRDRCFITTAISYPNGSPHIGHAYESIAADVYRRFHGMLNRSTRLCTGTDEHGLKMAQTARQLNVSPQQLADQGAEQFRAMNDALNVKYDYFVRTTSSRHHETAKALWNAMKDDLYLGKYQGWYSVRDEAYFDESELTMVNGRFETLAGNPVEWMEEETWFFRLTAYRDRLKQFHTDHPEFLQPTSSRNEILAMLDGLGDISVSRTNFDWGIPVPDSPGHVMYVWVDALANYITGAGENEWWPVDLHIIGKDIAKFHAIYWLAFLMSANLPLPGKVFCHGHLLHNGRKMSKSVGNVVDPFKIISKVGTDALRYYLMADIPFGQDGDFNEDRLKDRYNTDLANGFGNLVSRTFRLITKAEDGRLKPDMTGFNRQHQFPLLQSVSHLCSSAKNDFENLNFSHGIEKWNSAVAECNSFIHFTTPWNSANGLTQNQKALGILYVAIYMMAAVIAPVIPDAISRLNDVATDKNKILFPRLP